jgi:WD40 repeat protein
MYKKRSTCGMLHPEPTLIYAQLPVLSLDISSDSKLIVTCSADKNVKIWGMDFGDCHKSIFAHDESIMQVAFEKESHYFWTVGKDRFVKYWDGDKVGAEVARMLGGPD